MGTRCKASALPRWLGSLRLPHSPQPRRRNRLQTINQGVGPFYVVKATSTTRSPTVAAKSSSARSSPAPARLSRREKLLAFARKGDVVVVWKLDRLGRSLRDLIDVVNSLQDRGIGLRSLQEAIDTTTPAGKLTFHIFAALAEFERDMIRERTRAGLAAAHKRAWPSDGREHSRLSRSSWPRR